MTRAVLLACMPWLAVLIVSLGVLYLLARLSGARIELGRLRRLHADQQGSAQSLSFVLTLPLFIMVLMFIVQVSQLMIGQIVVEYAAFAGARAAAVWIPADLSPTDAREGTNCISGYSTADSPAPIFIVNDPSDDGTTYLIQPSGAKYGKIRAAAVMACAAISPSRDLGATGDATSAVSVGNAYGALAPTSFAGNGKTPERIRNKLVYAADLGNTVVEVRFFHSNTEPPENPLGHDFFFLSGEKYFQFNEVGRRDPIMVTVTHNLALLPGPGRLLARSVAGGGGRGGTATNVSSDVYTYPLSASAMLVNEGERSAIPYVYGID